MAKITSFTINSIDANGGNVTAKLTLNPINDSMQITINENASLALIKEQIIYEIKRRNKLDDTVASMQSLINQTVVI